MHDGQEHIRIPVRCSKSSTIHHCVEWLAEKVGEMEPGSLDQKRKGQDDQMLTSEDYLPHAEGDRTRLRWLEYFLPILYSFFTLATHSYVLLMMAYSVYHRSLDYVTGIHSQDGSLQAILSYARPYRGVEDDLRCLTKVIDSDDEGALKFLFTVSFYFT